MGPEGSQAPLQTPFPCSEPSGPPPVRLPAEVEGSGILGSVASSSCSSDSWAGPLRLLPVLLEGMCPSLWGGALGMEESRSRSRHKAILPWFPWAGQTPPVCTLGRQSCGLRVPKAPRAGVCADTEVEKDGNRPQVFYWGASPAWGGPASQNILLAGRGQGSVPTVGSAQARSPLRLVCTAGRGGPGSGEEHLGLPPPDRSVLKVVRVMGQAPLLPAASPGLQGWAWCLTA